MTKSKKIEYPCQTCGKQAVYNLQDGGFVLYDIINDEKFEKNDSWAEGEQTNDFYCEECYEKEMKI